MDRIKKALEKSRSSKRRSPARPQQFEAERGAHPFDNIVYTRSKQIEVGQNILSESRLIAGNPSDPRALSFKMLRTQALQIMRENGWSTIAVTGPTAGAGKSLVAINLAISMSLEVNQTVLLVDLDLRNPSIHQYFAFEPEYGLLDYLTGEAKIEDMLVNPGFKRLLILPSKGSTSESSELLSSPQMIELAKELKLRYKSRMVIYDLPPVLNTDDALVFLPNVDSTLLVVENGRNTTSEVQNSMRMLEGTNILGTVLNKADEDIREYY
jgi:capsular exopolysaccharide synthesis family protein